MARRDPRDCQLLVEDVGDTFDFFSWGDDQVEAAGDDVQPRVDLRRLREDVLEPMVAMRSESGRNWVDLLSAPDAICDRESMNRREIKFAAALGLGAAIGGLGYWLSGASGPPAHPQPGSVQQAMLDAFRDEAGDAGLGLLFDELNARHFGGELPNVKVMWASDLDRLDIGDYRLNGMTDGKIILLKAALMGDDADVRRTLCHEMVHVKFLAAGNKLTTHETLYQDELRRIFDDGCFHAIYASPDERASLKQWIDAERARLDAIRLQIGAQGAEIKMETERVERAFAGLNERIRAANAAGSGWPSRDETAAVEGQRSALNDRILAYNNAAATNQRDQAVFNEAVQRYNLMLAYPDGLAEDRAKGLIR